MHRGDHGLGVPHGPGLDAGDGGRATRPGDDEPGLLQAEQRLADRGAAHPEPGGELLVTQLLARAEGAVDDRVPHPA